MKVRTTSYTFNAAAKTITAADFATFGLAGIQIIANALTGAVIYNFADPAKGGTLAGNVLTLDFNTTVGMSNSDPLMILCEDGLQILPAVHFQDVIVTGQGSQTAINNNVILATAGAGAYDTLNAVAGQSFRSFTIQITPAAGTVTAGVITFEGSNDNVNFTPIFVTDIANITAVPVTNYTLVAATSRFFRGATDMRYIRARISTGITGTTTGVGINSPTTPWESEASVTRGEPVPVTPLPIKGVTPFI